MIIGSWRELSVGAIINTTPGEAITDDQLCDLPQQPTKVMRRSTQDEYLDQFPEQHQRLLLTQIAAIALEEGKQPYFYEVHTD